MRKNKCLLNKDRIEKCYLQSDKHAFFYSNSYLALKCVQTNTESIVGKFSCWSPLCVLALQLFTFLSFFFSYFSLITVGLVFLYSFWVFSSTSSVLSLFETALMQTVWDMFNMFMFVTEENSKQFFDQSWNEKNKSLNRSY